MNATYLNEIRDHGKTLITHIGLVDELDAELTGGSYTRLAVTWTNDGDGVMRPNANLVFDVPGGNTVAGWRGYSASEAGTDYGGADLTPEEFAGDGEYTLVAASSGIVHSVPV